MLNTSCTDVDDVICLDDSLDEKSIFFFVQCNAELQKHRLGKVTHFLTFESNKILSPSLLLSSKFTYTLHAMQIKKTRK